MKLIFVSSRSATVLLDPEGNFLIESPACLSLNGQSLGDEQRSVVSLFDLMPDTAYVLTMVRNGQQDSLSFHTEKENYTLDVRRFGAVGDGVSDDTAALQAAILCCPEGGRIRIPSGVWRTGPLFLKSHITLEICKGAVLSLLTDRNRLPILPGDIQSEQEDCGDLLFGSWEGNPLDCFAALLTGINVEDVRIIGEGIADGRGDEGDWWRYPREKIRAYRGRLLYLRGCKNITVQGITFRNSPSWNVHPTFSQNLSFLNITVIAPAVSPNTDGFDPESCQGVRLFGALFSVGDDCIAIKSGKIYLGRSLHMPTRDVEIAWCAMLDGHGGVTVGSEMAGGVQQVRVHHCWMRGNDRGLRIKTRRDRGKNGVIDEIRFEDVRMEGVKIPLVVNSLYFCDPDGHSQRVQTLEPQPVDDSTPFIGTITFERVHATGCRACVGYILGLPEQPVRHVTVRDCDFDFIPDAEPMVPAMSEVVPSVHNRGIIARFIENLTVENVTMKGIQGDPVQHL